MRKSSTPKAAVKKRRATRRKTTSKVVAKQARDEHQPTNPKVVADSALQRKSVTKFNSREVGDTRRMVAAQFEKFRDTQVPETMRALAERSVSPDAGSL